MTSSREVFLICSTFLLTSLPAVVAESIIAVEGDASSIVVERSRVVVMDTTELERMGEVGRRRCGAAKALAMGNDAIVIIAIMIIDRADAVVMVVVLDILRRPIILAHSLDDDVTRVFVRLRCVDVEEEAFWIEPATILTQRADTCIELRYLRNIISSRPE